MAVRFCPTPRMIKYLVLLTALSACTVSCKVNEADLLPPPIKDGKCLVDEYKNVNATKQTCNYGGYVWSCTRDDQAAHACTRGAEAVSERAPAVDAGR